MADPTSSLDPSVRSDVQLAGRMLRSLCVHEDHIDAMIRWHFDGFVRHAHGEHYNHRIAMTHAREIRQLLRLTLALADRPNVIVEHRHDHAVSVDRTAILTAIDRLVERIGTPQGVADDSVDLPGPRPPTNPTAT